MKQKIGVFLLSALLVLSLSACGEMGGAVGDNDILGDDYATTGENSRQGHSPNNGTNGANYNQDNSSNKGTDTRKGVLEPNGSTGINGRNGGNGGSSANGNNISGGSNGSSTNGSGNGGAMSRNGQNEGLFGSSGTSYEQMLRNGMVNDTDGDLTDGENPHS